MAQVFSEVAIYIFIDSSDRICSVHYDVGLLRECSNVKE